MKFKRTLLATCILASAIGFTVSNAKAQKLLSEDDVKKIVADYIAENPEALLDSLENFRVEQQARSIVETRENIQKNLAELTSTDTPWVGSTDADVIIVEFFDYNCGYCKRALPDIAELVKNDKKVRVYFKEMPILSPLSAAAAKWALAAHKQGRYFEYHSALMESRAEKTEETLEKLGKQIGLDVKKLKSDANSDEIAAQLEKDVRLAREIGVQGTPAFVVNGEFKPGYLGPDGLATAVKNARENTATEEPPKS